jgi:hypothetical protein
MRRPLVITAWFRHSIHRIFRLQNQQPKVDWRETCAEMGARFFVGLAVGAGLCVFLFVVLVWPSPPSGRSFLEQLGWSDRKVWIFPAVLIGSALVGALTTRAKLRQPELEDFLFAASRHSELDDRVKTGCMGLLLPLGMAAYGLYYIRHPRMLNRFGRVMETDVVIGMGIMAVGMAVFVHALGFVPYERISFLKWLVAAVGVGVFIYGLTWPHTG